MVCVRLSADFATPVRYRLQLQSPLPVLQWEQRQELDLQKQLPFGAAAFSAGVGSAGAGGGVQPAASRTAASTMRSFFIVPSWSCRTDSYIPHKSRRGRRVAVRSERKNP